MLPILNMNSKFFYRMHSPDSLEKTSKTGVVGEILSEQIKLWKCQINLYTAWISIIFCQLLNKLLSSTSLEFQRANSSKILRHLLSHIILFWFLFSFPMAHVTHFWDSTENSELFPHFRILNLFTFTNCIFPCILTHSQDRG